MDNTPGTALVCHHICFAKTPNLFSPPCHLCVTFSDSFHCQAKQKKKKYHCCFASAVSADIQPLATCLHQHTHAPVFIQRDAFTDRDYFKQMC